MKKKNTNCLQGIRCPKCKSLGAFDIVMEAVFFVEDDGFWDFENAEWNDESVCTCRDCGNAGTIKDFTIKERKTK